MTSTVEDIPLHILVCMEGSSAWAVASGCFDSCLPSFSSLISKEATTWAHSSPCFGLTTWKKVFPWEEDSHGDLSGVGIRVSLQSNSHSCISSCHTGLRTSKHAQPFSFTPCHVLFLTFPLRDRSTSEKKIIQLIWSLGTHTKGKNNNSAAALLICIENSGSFFADPTDLPHIAVKLYAYNPERQLEFSAIGCQMSCS